MRRLPVAPSISALVAFVATLGLFPSLLVAEDEVPARGDFAARTSDLGALLDQDLSDAEARALFEDLRALLISRVGGDVVSDADLYLGAIHGMLQAVNRRQDATASPLERALPDDAMLLTDADAGELRSDLQGRMTGIGIDFRFFPDHGVLFVMDVLPGSPGDAAGIRAGDSIVAVDGFTFGGARVDQVLETLQGQDGKPMTLHVSRGEGAQATLFRVSVTRSVFPVRSTRAELAPDGVGWVHAAQLHAGTPKEIEDELARLDKLGADRFVLDLRGCQGGSIDATAGVADLFLAKSAVVVRLVEPGVGEQDLVAKRDPLCGEPELVVLVNRWTQGACEALALALKEHDRAYVIGETTMGSARAETLVPVGHGLVLRLDSVRLESPLGHSWQGRGVEPDQTVELKVVVRPAEVPGGTDSQFQTAVHYLHAERD